MQYQKTISIQSFTLNYLESNPEAEKVVFLFYGNCNSSLIWKNQLYDVAFKNFHLIAFDLPGHGRSSRADVPDQAYNIITLGSFIAEAVHKLNRGRPFVLAGLLSPTL